MDATVAFITGGSTGIGLTIAQTFLKGGSRVFILSRKEANLSAAVVSFRELGFQETRFACAAADVRKFEQMAAAARNCVATFGRIDFLVNCAAGNFLCPAAALSSNAFRTVVDIDLVGSFNATRAVYDAFFGEHGGIVVNVSATLQLMAAPAQAHAGAAKAGLDGLTRMLGTEWSRLRHPIRVVGVSPGPVPDTEGFARLAGDSEDDARLLVTRQEVADVVAFLCSPKGACINAQTLVIDRAHHLARGWAKL